jgi:hypothetical protein
VVRGEVASRLRHARSFGHALAACFFGGNLPSRKAGGMTDDERRLERRAVSARISMPDYAEWERKTRATGACSNPIRMRGGRIVYDAETGEVLNSYHTDDDPLGYLMLPCGNRRAAVCPSCAEVYRYDAYQLVRAGLAGGKGVPDSVASHPMLFATLTAPSFGAVHARHKQTGRDGQPLPCRPRRDAQICPHGVTMSCFSRHEAGSTLVGQALCYECYDYVGAVLFNANAGVLWRRLSIYLVREIAKAAGLPRSRLRKVARVSFVKVAEYQARGVVHFHAVLRVDGPDGPADSPPAWATVVLLDECLRHALAAVYVELPSPSGGDLVRVQFGQQVDTQAIVGDDLAVNDGLTVRHVAGYVAKYATKSSEGAGSVPRRIKRLDDVPYLHLPEHTERMVRACFRLADRPAHAELRLDLWAHMLGYRGHCTTKSRRYSTTFGELRDARRIHSEAERRQRLGLQDLETNRTAVSVGEWRFVRSGLAYGEQIIVRAIRRKI